ncbi:MAG: BatA domain-containing protein [Flavobacteriales bacterium]|nr:BatA domain-containing protein [Flavobacteriales bacterium]
MYRFENIELLWLLLTLPVCWIVYLMMIRWRKTAVNNFGDSRLIEQLIPLRSSTRNKVKITLWSVAFVSLILGLRTRR